MKEKLSGFPFDWMCNLRIENSVIDKIKQNVQLKIASINWAEHRVEKFVKEDFSLVTEVDLYISDLIHDVAKKMNLNFFSEELQISMDRPCLILDPIDGTRELAKGIGECAISLSIHTKESDWAWIYNPFTGLDVRSDDIQANQRANIIAGKLLGLVSRSEFKKGIYDNFKCEDLDILPRGSIAFKLALLAAGACDFVYSRSSKNIWDIKAGTIICANRGIQVFHKGQEIEVGFEKRIQGDLLWCRGEYKEKIYSSIMKNSKM